MPNCCRRWPSPPRRSRSSRVEIRGLQKTEIGEIEEPFAKGQKGSSAMPHKRNPIGCEQITGLARLVRANAMAALENVALWHERDISHSSVERVILPDSFIALDHMLRRFTRIVRGMVVYPERMMENLQRSRGVVFSGTVLLELARRGISREQAYEWVQRNAMRAFHEQRDFKALLLEDKDLTQGAERRRDREGVRPRRALPERRRDLRARVRVGAGGGVDGPSGEARFVTLEPSVRAGRTQRRRPCTRGCAGVGDRGSGKTSAEDDARMKARVFVTLKPSVFDPQGRTIAEALHSMGYTGVGDVRQGKYFELEVDATSADEAKQSSATWPTSCSPTRHRSPIGSKSM